MITVGNLMSVHFGPEKLTAHKAPRSPRCLTDIDLDRRSWIHILRDLTGSCIVPAASGSTPFSTWLRYAVTSRCMVRAEWERQRDPRASRAADGGLRTRLGFSLRMPAWSMALPATPSSPAPLPHVVARGSFSLNVSQGQRRTTSELQRISPKLVFVND